jgi:SAM-dependent methyltransferase
MAHWSDVHDDPNHELVIADRAAVLARAWRPEISDRTAFIRKRIAGKRVLDVGCVAHDEARMQSSRWLHRHIAEFASECVGVDVLKEGVDAMNLAGFDAVCHNLSDGLGPLYDRGLFDAIVAGELIEHVGDIDMLFATASDALTAEGELILTTPNPYAPHRVRAGQRGVVWENVDHILYAFPSGIAELASRHGLVLAEAATTSPSASSLEGPITWLKRTLRGSRWHRRGFDTLHGNERVVMDRFDRLRTAGHRWSAEPRFIGETFVYVVTRPSAN